MKYTAYGSGLLFVILHASATAPLVDSALLGGVDETNTRPRYVALDVTWPFVPEYSVLAFATELPLQPLKKLSRPVTLSPGFVQSPQLIASGLLAVSTVPPWFVISGEPPP